LSKKGGFPTLDENTFLYYNLNNNVHSWQTSWPTSLRESKSVGLEHLAVSVHFFIAVFAKIYNVRQNSGYISLLHCLVGCANQALALENHQISSQIKLPLWKITKSGPKSNSFSGFILVPLFLPHRRRPNLLCEIAFFGSWAPRFHFGIIF